MTRPRQHWRKVRTKKGLIPRLVNKGRLWLRRHSATHPQTGDLTPEEAKELLFRATLRKRREELIRLGDVEGLREFNAKYPRLRLKYPRPPAYGV